MDGLFAVAFAVAHTWCTHAMLLLLLRVAFRPEADYSQAR